MKVRITAALCLFALVAGMSVNANACIKINQACTPGFFKNHPQFITGNGCTRGLNPNSLIGTRFPATESCVGSKTWLGLLQSSSSACGTSSTQEGALAQAEIILLRQALTRALNGFNSSPPACIAAISVIMNTEAAIVNATALSDPASLKALADKYGALNNDQPCTIGGSN